ncbi:filamentous hemagglutinin N-terminal domain-containing protein [Leptolyngbya sp. NK1-12]|uniref:Filamentous hemagglutinin N-terminal domain-containing protein n=1 Tax=Leptolyngbya sp. NK1-12 TaxID=2547451 RepID=A0AA97AJ78_9CYAN|nr:filamentous hemagglutinin N-terminal domain-containing protein [Leptolyngbya sp. NK1-12]
MGNERSVVVPTNATEDRITGGAQRGRNLFHSFREFNVGESRQLYFVNPSNVGRIFTRVTGNNPSNLLGTLGVQGGADLMLLNPNGVVIGENARLDIQGSLLITTANAIQLGEQGFFSAINPELPSPLLTVNPSALWFNQLNAAPIVHRADSPLNIASPGFSSAFGLQMPTGRSLLLIGGDITLDGGGIVAPGGQVHLVAAGGPGVVGLSPEDSSLSLPEGMPRADISIINGSSIISTGNGSGAITVQGRTISLLNNSTIETGIARNSEADNQRIGDIELNATGVIDIVNSSYVENAVFPEATGISGDINVQAQKITLVGDNTRLRVTTFGNGSAGSLTIDTRQLTVAGGAQISSSTFGNGNAGTLHIQASDAVLLSGESLDQQSPGGIFSQVAPSASGQGGRILLETNRLTINDGSSIQITTFGSGNAGTVRIRANEIDIFRANQETEFATGIVAGIEGNIPSDPSNRRSGGRIRINANRLSLRNGGQVRAETNGTGDSGSIGIAARAIELTGNSLIIGSVREGAVGNGSPIRITAQSLFAEGGSQIGSFVTRQFRRDGQLIPGGRGNGGNIRIHVSDTITLFGTSRDGFSSGIFTSTERGARGEAGNIRIRVGNLQITDGAAIVANTSNAGDGGQIAIDARQITAQNGGQIATASRSRGLAGNISLRVTGDITLAGRDLDFANRRERARVGIKNRSEGELLSDIIVTEGSASGIFANTSSSGDGGRVSLNARSLSLTDRAAISARSQGEGVAGNIILNVDETLNVINSDITTSAANSSGGSINLTSERIRLRGDGDIRTEVASDVGNGGDITLTADSVVAFDDSDILAFAGNQGGDITFNTPAGFFAGGRQAVAASSTANLDQNNQVNINADGRVAGTIALPDVSFIENSLSALTETAINTDQLLANSCIARTQQGGTFLITGTGGLPAAPGNDAASTYPTGEVRTIPTEAETDSNWQPGDPIVEPQGVYRLPDGRWVMSRECTNRRTQSE